MYRLWFSALIPVLILAALLVPVEPVSAAKTRPRFDDKIQSEIDNINLQLDYLKLKVSDSLKKTRKLETMIRDKKNETAQLQAQVEQLSERQGEMALQIVKLEEESLAGREKIKSLMERYRSRLVQLHKIRQGTLLSSVFSARNLNSFLNRYQMVKYLLQSDKSIFEDLKKQDQNQRKLAEELVQKQQLLESGKIEFDQKQKLLNNENAALKAMLSTVLLEKKLLLEKEKTLANAKSELEKEISKVEDTIKAPGFENELAAQPRPPTAKQITQPQKLPDNAPAAAKLMGFSWPIARSKRQAFEQTGDINSPAVQILVNNETEVQAAARGKVLYKGTIGGLGSVIILGHQRGFSTVYAKLDDMWVGLGQIVDRDETIGKISAGRSRELHFEIRFGGKKQKPLDYLPKEM